MTPVQQPLAATTVTSPKKFVPLWPAVLPTGATLVQANESEFGPGSLGTGLLARFDDAGHATAVWVAVAPGAVSATPTTLATPDITRGAPVSDPSGTPVGLANGRKGTYTQLDNQASLKFAVGDVLVALNGTVSLDDLASAANGISVSADGVVTTRPGADNGWQVAIPPSSLAGSVEYRAIFEAGGERFAVSSSDAPPEISNIIQQSGPLTREHTAQGDVWHLAALSIGHRTDGTWVLVGSAEPPGLPVDERRAVLASLRPATPEERAGFSLGGGTG